MVRFGLDADVIAEALGHNGLNLEYARPEMKADATVVLAAVRATGHALRFAAPLI